MPIRTGASRSCSSCRRAEELERRAALPDRRDDAVAAAGARELVHGRVVVAARLEPGEVAHVDDRRVVVRRARLREPLERHRRLRDAGARRRRRCRRRWRPRLHAGVGRAVEAEGARDPDRAELLREALQPAAGEREVAVDPDERAGRHLLAVEQRVDDEERLLVLRARGIEQLAAARRARLPVGEDERRSGPGRGAARGRRGRPRRPARDRPSTRRRGSRRRSATAGRGRARSAPRASAGSCSRVSGIYATALQRRQDVAARLEALPLVLDRDRVEAEVRARRQRPPRVGRVAVVRVDARHVVVLELLHVAVELDEALLLDDPHVARDVAGDPVAGRPPAEPAAVAGEVVEHVAHLPDVDRVEREVVEVRVAEVDERHHVVVGVDVEPDARPRRASRRRPSRARRCRTGRRPGCRP